MPLLRGGERTNGNGHPNGTENGDKPGRGDWGDERLTVNQGSWASASPPCRPWLKEQRRSLTASQQQKSSLPSRSPWTPTAATLLTGGWTVAERELGTWAALATGCYRRHQSQSWSAQPSSRPWWAKRERSGGRVDAFQTQLPRRGNPVRRVVERRNKKHSDTSSEFLDPKNFSCATWRWGIAPCNRRNARGNKKKN
jgi:hypothetical protein